MRTEHLVIVSHEYLRFYYHYCLESWCKQRCSIKHTSASDAAGCATKYHTVSCYCIGPELKHIDVDEAERLF